MLTTLNYLRYLLAAIVLVGLFYDYPISFSQEFIQSKINKKVPIMKEKSGAIIIVDNISIKSMKMGSIKAVVLGEASISDKSFLKSEKVKEFLSKFIKKDKEIIKKMDKHYRFSVDLDVTPVVSGSNISFKVKDIDMKDFKYFKKAKPMIISTIEKIKVKSKKLDSLSFVASVQNIDVKYGSLIVSVGASKFLLITILFLLLLREIGLGLIIFYQNFLSSKKNYCCAKEAVNGTGGTCSGTTKQAFLESGFLAGMVTYFSSKQECKEAYSAQKKKDSCHNNSASDACMIAPMACGTSFAGGASGASAATDVGSAGAGACDAGACDIGSC